MKREIKFRGKVKHHDPMTNPENGWVEGYYFQDLTQGEMRSYIFQPLCCREVIPQTVGQFTGLLDKNGKEIYEGDIIRIPETEFNIEIIGVVEFDGGSYVVRSFFSGTRSSLAWAVRERQPGEQRGVVIGNIHDNPELLKAETL